MSDYIPQTTFSTKDGLTTGNPEKIILGADFDVEFVELGARSADKEDSSNKGAANGFCGLDASSLVPVANLPVATVTAIGALEIATTLEAETLTADDKIVTPLKLSEVFADNDAVLEDLQALTSQAADSIYGWDLSATAAIGYTPSEGIQIVATNLLLDFSSMTAATPVGADTVAFYDATDSTHKKATITALEAALTPANMIGGVDPTTVVYTAGEGLVYSVGGTDLATTSTFDLDVTNLTAIDSASLAPADEYVLYDASATEHKKVAIQAVGPVITESATQSIALTDGNGIRLNTGTVEDTMTIDAVATTAYPIGFNMAFLTQGTAAIVVAGAVGVTINSLNSNLQVKGSGGGAYLVHTSTNVWSLVGDLEA